MLAASAMFGGAARSVGFTWVLAACGGEAMVMPSEVETVRVRFEYRASTEVDEAIIAEKPGCVQTVGFTHIHPSWRNYAVVRMAPEGPELWSATFSDVPIGGGKLRVSDANACETHRTGAVTAHAVYANGVLLTRAVDTPGDGIEPGFAFRVSAEGIVEP